MGGFLHSLLILLFYFDSCAAVNHWMLTPDGKYLKAVPYSPFLMKQPQNFVNFYKQGERVAEWRAAIEEFKLGQNRFDEFLDDPFIERRFMMTDPDCIKSNAIKVELPTFLSMYAVEQTENYIQQVRKEVFDEEYRARRVPKTDKLPQCLTSHTTQEFTAEFPLSELELANLKPNPQLIKVCGMLWGDIEPIDKNEAKTERMRRNFVQLLNDPRYAENLFVALGATCYWRILGNAGETIRCARYAVYRSMFGPTIHQAYVIFTLANIVHLMDNEDKAYKLYNMVDTIINEENRPKGYEGLYAFIHAGVADIFAIRTNFDLAISNYEKALEYSKEATKWHDFSPEIWSLKVAALKCHVKLTKELEVQEKKLKQVIEFKNTYSDLFKKIKHLEKEARHFVATDEKLQQSYILFDQIKYGRDISRKCQKVVSAPGSRRVDTLFCRITDPSLYKEEYGIERQIEKVRKTRKHPNMTIPKKLPIFKRSRAFEERLASTVVSKSGPTVAPKYPLDSTLLAELSGDRFWRRVDWPNAQECGRTVLFEDDIFDVNSVRSYFISPENKGFIVHDFLTKQLGLDINDQHPFPWEEPQCETLNQTVHLFLKRFFHIDINTWDGPDKRFAEEDLRGPFVRLANKRLELMDVAQRISTLIKENAAPQWISSNLAALYHRVVGNPVEAAICAARAMISEERYVDVGAAQLAQIILKVTQKPELSLRVLRYAAQFGNDEPIYHYLFGRMYTLAYRVDEGIAHLKEALDKDPSFSTAKDDLLELICNGKKSVAGAHELYPPVCCTSSTSAVCFRIGSGTQCYVYDASSRTLVYHRCNGKYTGSSYPTHPLVKLMSPFLSLFPREQNRRNLVVQHFDAGKLVHVEHDELPLDYGGARMFFKKEDEWWTRAKPKVRFITRDPNEKSNWEEDVKNYSLPLIPEKPLSFLWINDKKEMLKFDAKLPEVIPRPLPQQIRAGLQVLPPPKRANQMCSGVTKLSTLIETPVPTWVSVTAKGEDLEKYIDIRTPVPSVAGLVPECPEPNKARYSPLLTLDHLPIEALSDQLLFYRPEKGLAEALKALGNERETIEHVAARLHHAIKFSQLNSAGNDAHWLLTLVASLYWRVVGKAPRAVNCLRYTLQNAPVHMRDVALIALSNICHQSGLLNSALITAGMAFEQSPQLAAIHVTIANIYASIGNYERALEFYYSTLSLQPNFEPAKIRIRAIYCHSGQTFNFQV